jgi:hypothetical protein
MKYSIDFEGLKTYLETLKESDFQAADGNYNTNPDGIMKTAFLAMDKPNPNIPNGQVIQFGQPFLVDAIGCDLTVIEYTKKKYKLPTGRAIFGKFIKTIVSDCHKLYQTVLNGYWCIPSQFINYK